MSNLHQLSSGSRSKDPLHPDEVCKVCQGLGEDRVYGGPRGRGYGPTAYGLLRGNAENCVFCRVIVEALDLVGWGKDNGIDEQSGVEISLQETLSIRVRNPRTDLQIYTRTDSSDLPYLIKQRKHLSSTLDDSLRREVVSWLANPKELPPLPTRVLDLGLGESEDVRLYESSGVTGSYVALSHCWVNRPILKTEARSLHSHLAGIRFQALTPTFKDAVSICRWLGVRYLWIDALCIIQDDPQDVDAHVSNMDQIFRNSFFTLAAHGSSERETILPQPPKYHELALGRHKVYVREIVGPHFIDWDFGGVHQGWAEIQTRGWCFQERLLSRQVLHFTSHEILYERQGRIKACQCQFHQGIIMPARIELYDADDPRHSVKPWHLIVEKYSQLMFTYRKDLLPGLAGVARFFQMNFDPPPGEYVAGLWEKDLLEHLCWTSVSSDELPVPERGVPSTDTPLYPSFSWASRFGQCKYRWSKTVDREESCAATVIQIRSRPDPSNPFSRWLSCSLELKGKLFPVRSFPALGKDAKDLGAYLVPLAIADTRGLGSLEDQQLCDELSLDAVARRYKLDACDDIPEKNKLVYLFPLFQPTQHRHDTYRQPTPWHHGLVLVSIPSPRNNDGATVPGSSVTSPNLPAFRRIGFCSYIGHENIKGEYYPRPPFLTEDDGRDAVIELF